MNVFLNDKDIFQISFTFAYIQKVEGELFVRFLRVHRVYVRAWRANYPTIDEAMEASISERGHIVVESVSRKVGEDVQFGDDGSSVAGFTTVGSNENAELKLLGVVWYVDVVIVTQAIVGWGGENCEGYFPSPGVSSLLSLATVWRKRICRNSVRHCCLEGGCHEATCPGGRRPI